MYAFFSLKDQKKVWGLFSIGYATFYFFNEKVDIQSKIDDCNVKTKNY